MYEPKTYSTISSAKRAGKNKCLKNGWSSYVIARFGDIIMAAGPDERAAFDSWVQEKQIPVSKGDISLHLVYPPNNGIHATPTAAPLVEDTSRTK